MNLKVFYLGLGMLVVPMILGLVGGVVFFLASINWTWQVLLYIGIGTYALIALVIMLLGMFLDNNK